MTDVPYTGGGSVSTDANVNGVHVDAADNVYVFTEREAYLAWSKYDPFGNLIGSRVDYGWNDYDGIDPEAIAVNATGRSVVLSNGFVYAYDANGNRLWWRYLPSLLANSRPESVAISPSGRVYVGGGVGPDQNSFGFVMALSAAGATLYTTQLPPSALGSTRDGQVDWVAVDAAETLYYGLQIRVDSSYTARLGALQSSGARQWENILQTGNLSSQVTELRLVGTQFVAAAARTRRTSGTLDGSILVIAIRSNGAVVNNLDLSGPGSSFVTAMVAASANSVAYGGLLTNDPFDGVLGAWFGVLRDPRNQVVRMAIDAEGTPDRLLYTQTTRREGSLTIGELQRTIAGTGQRLDPFTSPQFPIPGGLAIDGRGVIYETYSGQFDNGFPTQNTILRRSRPFAPGFSVPITGPIAGFDEAADLAFDATGNSVLAGSVRGSALDRRGLVQKLERSGRRIWSTQLSLPGTELTKIAPVAGGDFVVAGFTSPEQNVGRALLARIDGATGRVEWQRTYAPSIVGQTFLGAPSVAVAPDGNLLLGATVFSPGQSLGWTARVSAATGVAQWTRLWGPTQGQAFWNTVVAMPDGGALVAGASNQPGGQIPTAARYGPTGNLVWVRVHLPAAAPSGSWQCAIVGPDGNVYLGGGADPNNTRPALLGSYTAAGALRYVRETRVTNAQIVFRHLAFVGNTLVAGFGSFRAAGFVRVNPATGTNIVIRLVPAPDLARLESMGVAPDGSVVLAAAYEVTGPGLPVGRRNTVVRLTRWDARNVPGNPLTVAPTATGAFVRMRALKRNAFGEWVAAGATFAPGKLSEFTAFQFR